MFVAAGGTFAAILLIEPAVSAAKQSGSLNLAETLVGTEAGLCTGVGNGVLASGLTVLGGAADANLFQLAAAVLMAATGIMCTGASVVFANRGYHQGRVVVVTTVG